MSKKTKRLLLIVFFPFLVTIHNVCPAQFQPFNYTALDFQTYPPYLEQLPNPGVSENYHQLKDLITNKVTGGLGQGALLSTIEHFFGSGAHWLSDLSLDMLMAQSGKEKIWRVATSHLRYTQLPLASVAAIVNLPLLADMLSHAFNHYSPVKVGSLPIILEQPELADAMDISIYFPYQPGRPESLIIWFKKPYICEGSGSMEQALNELSDTALKYNIKKIELTPDIKSSQVSDLFILQVVLDIEVDVHLPPLHIYMEKDRLIWLTTALRNKKLVDHSKLFELLPALQYNLWYSGFETKAILNPLSTEILEWLSSNIIAFFQHLPAPDSLDQTPAVYPVHSGYFTSAISSGGAHLWIDKYSGQEALLLRYSYHEPDFQKMEVMDYNRLITEADWLHGYPPLHSSTTLAASGYLDGVLLSGFQQKLRSPLPEEGKYRRHKGGSGKKTTSSDSEEDSGSDNEQSRGASAGRGAYFPVPGKPYGGSGGHKHEEPDSSFQKDVSILGLACPACLKALGDVPDKSGHNLCMACSEKDAELELEASLCPFCRIGNQNKWQASENIQREMSMALFRSSGLESCQACQSRPLSYRSAVTGVEVCSTCNADYQSVRRSDHTEYREALAEWIHKAPVDCPLDCDQSITFSNFERHSAYHQVKQQEALEEKLKETAKINTAMGKVYRETFGDQLALNENDVARRMKNIEGLLDAQREVEGFNDEGEVIVKSRKGAAPVEVSEEHQELVRWIKDFHQDPVKALFELFSLKQSVKLQKQAFEHIAMSNLKEAKEKIVRTIADSQEQLEGSALEGNIITDRQIESEAKYREGSRLVSLGNTRTQAAGAAIDMLNIYAGQLERATGEGQKREALYKVKHLYQRLKSEPDEKMAGKLLIDILNNLSKAKTCFSCFEFVSINPEPAAESASEEAFGEPKTYNQRLAELAQKKRAEQQSVSLPDLYPARDKETLEVVTAPTLERGTQTDDSQDTHETGSQYRRAEVRDDFTFTVSATTRKKAVIQDGEIIEGKMLEDSQPMLALTDSPENEKLTAKVGNERSEATGGMALVATGGSQSLQKAEVVYERTMQVQVQGQQAVAALTDQLQKMLVDDKEKLRLQAKAHLNQEKAKRQGKIYQQTLTKVVEQLGQGVLWSDEKVNQLRSTLLSHQDFEEKQTSMASHQAVVGLAQQADGIVRMKIGQILGGLAQGQVIQAEMESLPSVLPPQPEKPALMPPPMQSQQLPPPIQSHQLSPGTQFAPAMASGEQSPLIPAQTEFTRPPLIPARSASMGEEYLPSLNDDDSGAPYLMGAPPIMTHWAQEDNFMEEVDSPVTGMGETAEITGENSDY